jgi:cytochrome P450
MFGVDHVAERLQQVMAPKRPTERPLGATVTVEQLDRDPRPVLARLRELEPVSWIPALDCWLVTSYGLVVQAMRDSETFTVDDPRFSTARVIGPSMLSLDGDAHARHRAPFTEPFRPRAVAERFATVTAERTTTLLDQLAPRGRADLRREFAAPLAASISAGAVGLQETEADAVLKWYGAIVAAVTSITAGEGITDSGELAFASLTASLERVLAGDDRSMLADAAAHSDLSTPELVSNVAVLLFGGIETTEGMIANAALHLLERPEQIPAIRADPKLLDAAIDESLRLEPAAAVVDRYATMDVEFGGAPIRAGDLVRLSIAAANRDPAVFANPDEFDLTGANGRRHLAFAHGPHVCLGVHLARLEARTAIQALLDRLPALRTDPDRPAAVRGLVFRKPPTLHVLWDSVRS